MSFRWKSIARDKVCHTVSYLEVALALMESEGLTEARGTVLEKIASLWMEGCTKQFILEQAFGTLRRLADVHDSVAAALSGGN